MHNFCDCLEVHLLNGLAFQLTGLSLESKDKNNVLFLHDDGSFYIFSFGMGSGTRGLELLIHDCNINSEQVKKLGPGVIMKNTQVIVKCDREVSTDA